MAAVCIDEKPAAAGIDEATAKESAGKKVKIDKATAKGSADKDINTKIDKATMKLKGPYIGKSYIAHGNPPRLVVACTHKQQVLHKPKSGFHEIIENIFKKIKNTPGATRKMATQWRNELLA